MKYALLILMSACLMAKGMDHLMVDHEQKQKDAVKKWLLPKELCAKIAAIKSNSFPVIVQCDSSYSWRSEGVSEVQVFSKTWLTTRMTSQNLFEKQLWVRESAGIFTPRCGNDSLQFRFDNDAVADNNYLICKKLGPSPFIGYDGPNNDGDEGSKIEGASHGVILMCYSYKLNDIWNARFYLFKQHGISSQEYSGVQKKIPGIKKGIVALEYEEFPYRSEPLVGQKGMLFALASKDRGILLTKDDSEKFYLHVFEYTFTPNKTDPCKPDQSFTTKMIARAEGVPQFKRIAWLYGKTLVGLSSENELYLIALDDKNHTISCFKQKTDRQFIDFALGRPYSQHEIVLVDQQNQLYYANLKFAGSRTHIWYKKIFEAAQLKSNQKKAKEDLQARSLSHSEIKRVWIYDDLVGLHQPKPHNNLKPIDYGDRNEDGYVNYISLRQNRLTAEAIAHELEELKNTKPVEEKRITEKKKRRKK